MGNSMSNVLKKLKKKELPLDRKNPLHLNMRMTLRMSYNIIVYEVCLYRSTYAHTRRNKQSTYQH